MKESLNNVKTIQYNIFGLIQLRNVDLHIFAGQYNTKGCERLFLETFLGLNFATNKKFP